MKRVIAVILLFTLCCSLSGCYDKREVDDLAYVMAIGFDKGSLSPVRVTFQLAVPTALSGGGGGGGGAGGGGAGGGGAGGGGGKPFSIITVEAPALTSALDMANNFLSRRLELSHAEVAVFSEELARSGKIDEYLRGMVRNREFRPTINIVVAKGSAEDYIKSIKPVLDIIPSKYYELTFNSYKYTGLNVSSQLFKFYSQMESPAEQPVAVLAGVGKYKSSKDVKPGASTNGEKGMPQPFEGNYQAGSIPKTGEMEAEIEGLAVFDGDKMVGEMDGEDATDCLMVTGDFHTAYKTIPDPRTPDVFVVLNVTQGRPPVRRVELVDGKPKIGVKITLDADIMSIQSGYNYESPANLPILEQAASSQFQGEIARFLGRTAGEFHSDSCGFGREARGLFLTWKDFEDYDWLQKYKDATFEVQVRVQIRRPGQILRSEPIRPSAGESLP